MSGLDVKSGAGKIRAAAAAGLPAGISVEVTGRDALGEASNSGGGSSILLEALIGGRNPFIGDAHARPARGSQADRRALEG